MLVVIAPVLKVKRRAVQVELKVEGFTVDVMDVRASGRSFGFWQTLVAAARIAQRQKVP